MNINVKEFNRIQALIKNFYNCNGALLRISEDNEYPFFVCNGDDLIFKFKTLEDAELCCNAFEAGYRQAMITRKR